MRTELADPVRYRLPIGDELVDMNACLGEMMQLRFLGEIVCVGCGQTTPKSYNQGFCYPCFKARACNDMCMMKPEECHFERGTCREPEWGRSVCFQSHTVYLANSSGLKVGITRTPSLLHRWMDQGATQGLAIRRVSTRLDAGRCEVALAEYTADKTDWRRLLLGPPRPLDLARERDELLAACPARLPGEPLPDERMQTIRYPVLRYPPGARAHRLEVHPFLWGTLLGIKGQYLLFDTGVVNVRKYSGYVVELV